MSKKIIGIYEALLATAGCTVEDGCVSQVLAGESNPVMVKGKRLVLPTTEHLKNPDRTETILFHPLLEHLSRGESVVVEKFRNMLNTRFDYTFNVLLYQLMLIAASPAEHNKLNPDQTQFLSKVKNATEKTLHTLEKLMANKPVDGNHKNFISIFLKRSGMVKGKNYRRVGVVSWPMFEELQANKKKVLDVTVSDKDRETILGLIQYIVPDIETDFSYNVGSNSEIAPNLDALMMAAAGVASAINGVVELFGNVLVNKEELIIPDDWADDFDNLAGLVNDIRMIPMQAGNEGNVKDAPAAVVAEVAAPEAEWRKTATAVAPGRPWEAPPVAAVQPVATHHRPPDPPGVVHTDRGLDYDQMLRLRGQQQVAPTGYGQGYGPQGQQPYGQLQQPGYPPGAHPHQGYYQSNVPQQPQYPAYGSVQDKPWK